MTIDKTQIEIGMNLIAQENYQAAIRHFSQLLKKQPEHTTSLYFRAIAYRRLKNVAASIKDLDNAIELSPLTADYFSERGVSKFHAKDVEGALEDLNHALILEPQNPFRYSSLAYIEEFCGNTQQAIAYYQKAIELDPEDDVAHNNLGLLEEKLGRIEAAKRMFAKADELAQKRESKSTTSENKTTKRKMTAPTAQQEIVVAENVQATPKSLWQIYFTTLKELFTSAATRKEFIDFVKTLFKQS